MVVLEGLSQRPIPEGSPARIDGGPGMGKGKALNLGVQSPAMRKGRPGPVPVPLGLGPPRSSMLLGDPTPSAGQLGALGLGPAVS